ncbi:MAG: recombination directionality factor [Candidatus Geothermincolia bacterium]
MTPQELPCGIEGITDVMHLVRAGRIRTGEKIAKNGKEYPAKWDCFNFADAPKVAEYYAKQKGVPMQDAQGKWIEPIELSRQLKIRELDFLFPIDDKREVLEQGYFKWGAGGAWSCRGNGVTAWDREAEDEIECLGEDCPEYKEEKCKRQSRLSVVLYNVSGGLTIYDIVSSGRQTAKNLSSGIDLLRIRFGQINNVPLKLYLRPYQTHYYSKDGKPHKTTPFCLMIDFEASLLDIEMLKARAGQQVIMPGPPAQLADDMYPRSLQEAEKPALPPAREGAIIEQPAIAAVPEPDPEPEPADEPEPEPPAADSSAEVNSIMEGFRLCNIPESEWPSFFANYAGDLPGLQAYLSNLLDSQLPHIEPAEPPAKPAPRKQKPATETPAPAQPAAKPRTRGKALF